jgi:hypothetical protein
MQLPLNFLQFKETKMTNMFSRRCKASVLMFLVLICGIAGLGQKGKEASDKATVEGLVRDVACPVQDKRTAATKFNLKCALECAKNGSPLIILTNDGVVYTPISDSMPDKDQRQRLMPFVGKYVKVTGKIYERTGTRAIAIDQITEMKDVHLITDAE